MLPRLDHLFPAMPPKQVVAGGTVALYCGNELPQSTFDSEMLRLLAEAQARGATNMLYVRQQIKQKIRHLYVHICWKCNRPITMHYEGQPLIRRLMDKDVGPDQDIQVFWHTEGWAPYQVDKRNVTRRHREAVNRGVVNPPPPAHPMLDKGYDPQPAARTADDPPPSPAVLPGVGNPQKRKADDLAAD